MNPSSASLTQEDAVILPRAVADFEGEAIAMEGQAALDVYNAQVLRGRGLMRGQGRSSVLEPSD